MVAISLIAFQIPFLGMKIVLIIINRHGFHELKTTPNLN